MLRLRIDVAVRADDESDIKAIASELKRRLETAPALRQEMVKAIAVTAVVLAAPDAP